MDYVEDLKEVIKFHYEQAVQAEAEGRNEDADWHWEMRKNYHDELFEVETNDADWL
jgi:hypothetical protein